MRRVRIYALDAREEEGWRGTSAVPQLSARRGEKIDSRTGRATSHARDRFHRRSRVGLGRRFAAGSREAPAGELAPGRRGRWGPALPISWSVTIAWRFSRCSRSRPRRRGGDDVELAPEHACEASVLSSSTRRMYRTRLSGGWLSHPIGYARGRTACRSTHRTDRHRGHVRKARSLPSTVSDNAPSDGRVDE